MIYIFILLLFIVFAYLEAIELNKVSAAIYGILISVIMIAFATLRDKVGTDWLAYYNAYSDANKNMHWEVEAGYSFFNDFFSKSGCHFNVFVLFLNTVSLSLYYSSLKRNVGLIAIALLIFYSDYFLYYNFSGIRQALAISILIYSVRFCVSRNFFGFILALLAAMSFHVTAIVFFIAYFIPFRKITRKEGFVALSFFLTVSFLIFAIVELLSPDLAYKAKFYLELQENAPDLKSLFVVGIFKRLLIIGMVWLFGKNIWQYDKAYFFFNTYLFGFGLYVSTYLLSPDIGVRLSSYFIVFEIFLAGYLLLANSKLTTRLIIVTVFSMIALYKIYTYTQMFFYQYNFIFLN